MNPTTPRQLRRLIYQMIDAYAGTGDATDHGTLTGLSDDDHNQYAKKASNLSDLTSASTARTNLGLGSLATASNINGSNWSGTDLAVTDGGTGASDAPGARTNLGLVIGTDVQAYNANLTTWAGKTAPTGTVVGTSDTQTLTGKTIDADNNTISNIALGAEATGAVNDLSDVTITTPADNEVLAYDNGTSTWINQTPAEAGISATGHSHTESDISDLSHTVDVVSNVASSRILGRTTAGSGNSEELTASQVRTLLNVEDGADVTDTANVTSAGALMDSELTDLAGVKALNTSTLQLKPSEGAFANGDKTKLDGIETAADVTDATNVDAAGAVMNSDTSTASMSFVVDEDNMASDSATKVPTQQSVKAYADTKAAGSHTHTESDVTDLDHDAVKIRGVGVDSTVGTPSDGKILVYRSAGSDWVLEDKPASGSNPALNDVSDVTISTVADNEVLAYDNSTSEWINQTAAEAGLSATGHSHTESDISDLDHLTVADVLSAIYPVGSLYTSTNSSLPTEIANLGTWTVFGTGRVMVNQDTGDTDFDTLEETGGHKEMQQHNHGVTDPGHTHTVTTYGAVGQSGTNRNIAPQGSTAINAASNTTGITIDNEGTGDSGNLQPYIVVKTWKRTA